MPGPMVPAPGGEEADGSAPPPFNPLLAAERVRRYFAEHGYPAAYRRLSRPEKTLALDAGTAATGVSRGAFLRALARDGAPAPPRSRSPGAPLRYGPRIAAAVAELSRRQRGRGARSIIGSLPRWTRTAAQRRRLGLEPGDAELLAGISESTVKRILAAQRPRRRTPARVRRDRPAAPLQRATALRRWGEWRAAGPGEVQADTVFLSGGWTGGRHAYAVTVIAPFSGWVDAIAIPSLRVRDVARAVDSLWRRSPLPWTALHSDNGSELLNERIAAWCERRGIERTRGRPRRSNDQAYVENANRTFVRDLVGHGRYGPEAVAALNELFTIAAVFTNCFTAYSRRRGPALPAADRLIASGALDTSARRRVERLTELDPLALSDELERRIEALGALVRRSR